MMRRRREGRAGAARPPRWVQEGSSLESRKLQGGREETTELQAASECISEQQYSEIRATSASSAKGMRGRSAEVELRSRVEGTHEGSTATHLHSSLHSELGALDRRLLLKARSVWLFRRGAFSASKGGGETYTFDLLSSSIHYRSIVPADDG